MPRRPVNLHCSTQDRAQLETWMRGQAQEARLVLRAKIIVQGLNGFTGKEIAANLGVRPNTVSQWLRRFSEKGIAALHDRPRSGKPRQYDLDFRHKILTILEQTPPVGQAQWDGAAVARELGASPDAVCAGDGDSFSMTPPYSRNSTRRNISGAICVDST